MRSPSSPLPMSAGAGQLHGSSDEEEYRRAVEAKENFRRKHDGSANRNRSRDPMSPASVRSGKSHGGREGTQDRSETGRRSHNREHSEQGGRHRPPPLTTPSPGLLRLASEKSTGDLRSMKDERQLKKEAAARELEERRKSLARRPQAPIIPHPDELSPVSTRPAHGLFDLPSPDPGLVTLGSATYVPPQAKELPLRAASTGPLEAAKNSGMYANRGAQIGLPATPKAMRLALGSESSWSSNVPVPPIPATFAQASPGLSLHSNNPSPNKVSPKVSPKTVPEPKQEEAPPASLVTLLPSTVYTPPPTHSSLQVRPPIARSMSVPLSPPDVVSLPAAAGNAGSRGMPRGHHLRKSSTGEAAALISGRRPSHDSQMVPPPPPPPPAPPLLKELQHLAAPPPPPPAPLPPYATGRSPVTPSRMHPGMVEVITDEDNGQSAPAGVAIPISETTVPIIAPPAPPSSRGHMRGRSSTDNSIGARLSRATERMRSASRGRVHRDTSRTKSPEVTNMIAPYESIPLPPQMSFQARSEMTRSPVARADMTKSPPVRQDIQGIPQNDYRTGLHRSEMI